MARYDNAQERARMALCDSAQERARMAHYYRSGPRSVPEWLAIRVSDQPPNRLMVEQL